MNDSLSSIIFKSCKSAFKSIHEKNYKSQWDRSKENRVDSHVCHPPPPTPPFYFWLGGGDTKTDEKREQAWEYITILTWRWMYPLKLDMMKETTWPCMYQNLFEIKHIFNLFTLCFLPTDKTLHKKLKQHIASVMNKWNSKNLY